MFFIEQSINAYAGASLQCSSQRRINDPEREKHRGHVIYLVQGNILLLTDLWRQWWMLIAVIIITNVINKRRCTAVDSHSVCPVFESPSRRQLSLRSWCKFIEGSKKNSMALVSERTIPSDRSLLAKLVPIFPLKGCRVASAADLLRPYSRLSRPEPLLFLPSSSSIVLTGMSGPLSKPATSQKIW
jgi:hypothetical protein